MALPQRSPIRSEWWGDVGIRATQVVFPKKSSAKEPELMETRHHVADLIVENKGLGKESG